MPSIGKPDATGRSSGRLTGREKTRRGPPQGEPWVWLTTELIASPAFRACGINTLRLLLFLLVEHRNHAGMENGYLVATHRQLKAWGLTPDLIRAAIEEARALGLVLFKRGGRWAGTNTASRYRLTFYPDHEGNPATNDWRYVDDTAIAEWRKEKQSLRPKRLTLVKNRSAAPTSRGSVVQISGVR